MADDSNSTNNLSLLGGPIDYEAMAEIFNMALINTLRKHSIADTFLDYWVPDADPVLGIASMVDSARIAGVPRIEVRFKKTTLAEDRLTALRGALAGVCKLDFTDEGKTFLLHANEMNRDVERVRSDADGPKAKPTYWQAERLAGTTRPRAPVQAWGTETLPEFADIRPEFRAGLKVRFEHLVNESAPGAVPGEVALSGSEDGVTLHLAVDPASHTVNSARHTGGRSPGERAVLDLFCELAPNLPIQEVADHVSLKVIDRLVDDDKAPPVPGVLMPANSGAPFVLAGRLARLAYDGYRARTGTVQGTNFYYPPPQDNWQKLSSAERRERVEQGLRAFLQSEALYPDDMQILRVEKNKYGFEVRVVVAFSDRIAVEAKPSHMRRLEQKLRRDLEPEIDLVADRVKDSSPLRRLS